MSFDSVNWVLRQLTAFYHSIYFYVTLFCLGNCLLVHTARQRIYHMELTWGQVSLVYSSAGCLSAMATVVTYYTWVGGHLLWKQYLVHREFKRRVGVLFEIYRRQDVAAQEKQAKGGGIPSN